MRYFRRGLLLVTTNSHMCGRRYWMMLAAHGAERGREEAPQNCHGCFHCILYIGRNKRAEAPAGIASCIWKRKDAVYGIRFISSTHLRVTFDKTYRIRRVSLIYCSMVHLQTSDLNLLNKPPTPPTTVVYVSNESLIGNDFNSMGAP